MKRRLFFAWVIILAVLVFGEAAFAAAKKPATVAELALYRGADRQQILEEGAKKEGKLVFYTNGTFAKNLTAAFQKKYPYLKVESWRAENQTQLARILEEYKAGKPAVDFMELELAGEIVLEQLGLLQPFYSPELANIEEGGIKKAPGEGVFVAPIRLSGIGLGYNTKLITKEQLPKTYAELNDAKWKGKMVLAGSSTGVRWMGTMLTVLGEDFIKKVAKQDFPVQMLSARGLLDMIINGEYVFSPTIFDSHIILSRQKGAPVDWVPLEPVHVSYGQIALAKSSSHPHAALLFADFDLSKEAAEIYKAGGYSPTRKDIAPLMKAYKKFYGVKSLEEASKWDDLFAGLFLKR